MMKLLNYGFLIACLFFPIAQASDTDVDKALGKTKEGALELFEIAKEKTSEIGQDLLEKGSELGDQANEKAQESSEILWDKMKEIGSASKKLAEDGSEKLKDFACDLSDSNCGKEESQAQTEDLNGSI